MTNTNIERKQHSQENKAPRLEILTEELKTIFFKFSGLPKEEMDLDASFLELGFDSLFLTQAVAEINQTFNTRIGFRSLFESTPSIGSLGTFLNQVVSDEYFHNSTPINSSSSVQHPGIDLSIPILTADGGTENTLASAITHVIENVVDQKLQQILGHEINMSSTPKARKEVAPTQPTPKKGKRKTKGVTSKMKNYENISSANELSPQQKQTLEEFSAKYIAKTKSSKALTTQHRQYCADPRAVTGYSALWKEIVYQIASDQSKGSKIWDIDGNEYIDFVMSYGVALFGHMPDFIADAINSQVAKGNSLDVLPPKAKEVAQMICEISGMDRITLANTGTEAVLAAVRAARVYSGKDRIAVFNTDYHGMIDQFLVRGVPFSDGMRSLPSSVGIPKLHVENMLVLDYEDPDVLDVLKNNISSLGGVLIEPIQAQNPHWQHHELISEIRKLTREADVPLIFDEVINGFRLNQRGAQAWYGVEADIVAYGKTISGGLPLSAAAGKSKYMDAFDGGLWQFGDDSGPEKALTYFASTFIKNPLSVSAAHAAMSRIKEAGPKLQEDLNEKAREFCSRVKEIFLKTKAPIFIQNTSSMFMLKTAGGNQLARLFQYYLRFNGINIRERPCFVSTAHTPEDFEKAYQAIEQSIEDMYKGGLITPWEGEDLNQVVLPRVSYLNKMESTPGIAKTIGFRKIPITDEQQEIWLNNILTPDASRAYNIGINLELEGELDLNTLNKSIQDLINRHESLRTTIGADGKHQIIHANCPISVKVEDIRTIPDQAKKVKELEKTVTYPLFDLANGPLIRFLLIQSGAKKYQLTIVVHHIICDGWSLSNMAKELGVLYQNYGEYQEELPVPQQLSQLVEDSIVFKQTTDFERNEQFWVEQFNDKAPVLDLPTDFARPAVKSYAGHVETSILSEALVKKIREKAAKEGTTFFFFMMAIFKAYLYRISNQDDFVLGLAVAGHNKPKNRDLVAHAIHFLPIRSQLESNMSFATHLQQVRNRILDAMEHQEYTFGSLMKQLKFNRNASRNALISVAFNLDAPGSPVSFGALRAKTNPLPKRFETFDLFLNLKPVENTILVECNYNIDLFTNQTIKNRLAQFEVFIESVLNDFNRPLYQYNLLSEAEKQQILNLGKGEKGHFPIEKALHQLLEEQVQQTPTKTAIQFGNVTLNYQGLNARANQLARLIKEKGFQPGQRIGIFQHRSIDLLTSIYAVLKAGGSYVPLDPLNPKQRLELIIQDAQLQFVIATPELKGKLELEKEKWIVFKSRDFKTLDNHNLNLPVPAHQEAYVIYTSGSTGTPKGVGIRHESAVNTLYGINQHLEIGEADKMYSVSSMGFDMSIPDFFLSLTQGATLIMAEDEVKKDGFSLRKDLEKHQPTIMQATPTSWKLLLLAEWKGLPQLKVVAGGEGFSKDVAEALVDKCAAVWNGYGPTEATIYTTYKRITKEYLANLPSSQFAAIGKPIANMETFILDNNLELVPKGIPGELYIGGPGVANGYLNRQELTAKSFIQTVWSDKKLYKTGDLVRMSLNGDIEFLGRVDQQVKIRGFRIELGEIEACIKALDSIEESVVIVHKDKNSRQKLIAYIQLKTGTSINDQQIQTILKQQLPSYMVPKQYVRLEHFPLTASLKVDRKSLPEPTPIVQKEAKISLAETPEETMLAKIWMDILSLDQVDVDANFFELGGHSLAAVEMMARIKHKTGKELPLTVLFQNASIRKLASLLKTDEETEVVESSLVPIRTTGSKPPIYLIHGGGLHVLFYQTMTQYLDPDQPIYALQARGLNGKEKPFDTIEEMAAHYLKEIKELYPTGPYLLAGYSLGGLIAFEMAKQLIHGGSEVPFLGIFDSVAKRGTGHIQIDPWLKKWNKVKFNLYLLAKHPMKTVQYKMNILNMKLNVFGETKIAFKDQDTGEVIETASSVGKVIYQKSLEAFDKYTMEPLPLKVSLFKAKEQMFFLEDFKHLGWNEFAENGVDLHIVDGNHYTMFDKEHGKDMAEKVQKAIENALTQYQELA